MTELKKTLSSKVLLLITLNSVIGSGMFFLPAIGARVAGPASLISWIIISIISIYSAACFGELVALFPKSGGVYEYTKQAFGAFPSFLMGWVAWLVGNITTAMLIVGAITYLLPSTEVSPLIKIGVSLFWLLILNFMTYRGMKTSAIMLVSFSIVTLSIIALLIIPSWINIPALIHGSFITNIHVNYLFPFFIHHGLAGFIAISVAIFLISETFFGVESICFLAGETKDPEHVLPRTLVKAMIIVAILVILLVLTSLLVIPWSTFSGVTPLTGEATTLFGEHLIAPYAYLSWLLFGNIGRILFTLGTYLLIIGAAAGWVVTGPRLILSLAEDKMFPHQLASIHPKYSTPYKAIIFQAIISSIFILLALIGSVNGYEVLLEMLVPLVLLMMAIVVLIVPILRIKRPTLFRPYKVIFPIVGPILLSLFYLSLIVLWFFHDPANALFILKISISFVVVGLPVYLLLMSYYNPETIIWLTELFSYISLLLEDIILPKRIRKEILLIFKNLEEKHILDYGAGVGTLTLHLAKRTGKHGHITATDISAKNLRILDRRLKKRGLSNVKTIHDPHQVNRLHPSVRSVDLVFSVGMLSYVQDLRKVLRDINRVLPVHGKICFVEYIDYFRILPNPKVISSKSKLKRLFFEEGFSVTIVKIRGLFWNYLFVYGEKMSSSQLSVPYI